MPLSPVYSMPEWNPGLCASGANTLPTKSYSQPLGKYLPSSLISDLSSICECDGDIIRDSYNLLVISETYRELLK